LQADPWVKAGFREAPLRAMPLYQSHTSLPMDGISPIPVTLVTSRLVSARESAVAARIVSDIQTAILAEGLPDGSDPFHSFPNKGLLDISRVAPGCPCCEGHLTMRVTLNRLLRKRPQRLFISLASSSHLDRIVSFLSQPPYDKLLCLAEVLSVDDSV
jgi:hypothetical protein